MSDILQAKNLFKRFGRKRVLADFNMTLEQGQVYGLLAKNGEGKTTLIRMITATIFIWIFILSIGRLSKVLKSFGDKKAAARTIGGAVTGPFLGVWLSMVAVTYTVAGVAATLMSLMPVMIIPVVWILYKQKTSWRGILGAGIAVTGVAILFLM